MRVVRDNFVEVFTNWKYITLGLTIFLFLSYIFHMFTNYALIAGNYGSNYLYLQIISQVLISLLFAIFLPITIYKFLKYNSFSGKEQGSSFIATTVAVIVGGCPACSITIATYLGLAGIVAIFPYDGLELKLITIPLLGYVNYSTLKGLNTCNIKRKKKK